MVEQQHRLVHKKEIKSHNYGLILVMKARDYKQQNQLETRVKI